MLSAWSASLDRIALHCLLRRGDSKDGGNPSIEPLITGIRQRIEPKCSHKRQNKEKERVKKEPIKIQSKKLHSHKESKLARSCYTREQRRRLMMPPKRLWCEMKVDAEEFAVVYPVRATVSSVTEAAKHVLIGSSQPLIVHFTHLHLHASLTDKLVWQKVNAKWWKSIIDF